MANNQVLSAGERKGLMYGSLIAAGLSAALGQNPKDALLKAATGAASAYAGGLKNMYDMKQQELNIQSTKDLIEATKQKDILRENQFQQEREQQNIINAARERRLAMEEARSMREAERFNVTQNQLVKRNAAIDTLDIDPNLKQYYKTQPLGSVLPYISEKLGSRKQPKIINPSTAYNLADKYIPFGEIIAGKATPYSIDRRNEMVKSLATKIANNPDLLRNENLLNTTLQEIKDKTFPPIKWQSVGGFSLPEGVAISPKNQNSTPSIPPNFPQGSQFKGIDSEGYEKWLLPDGTKKRVKR